MTLDEDKLEGLEEIVLDAAKAKAILDAARSSMGEWRKSIFQNGAVFPLLYEERGGHLAVFLSHLAQNVLQLPPHGSILQ